MEENYQNFGVVCDVTVVDLANKVLRHIDVIKLRSRMQRIVFR